MKVRKVLISGEVIRTWLTKDHCFKQSIVIDGLPETAFLVGASTDGCIDGERVLSLMFWDESFEDLTLDEIIAGSYPVQDITIQSSTSKAIKEKTI